MGVTPLFWWRFDRPPAGGCPGVLRSPGYQPFFSFLGQISGPHQTGVRSWNDGKSPRLCCSCPPSHLRAQRESSPTFFRLPFFAWWTLLVAGNDAPLYDDQRTSLRLSGVLERTCICCAMVRCWFSKSYVVLQQLWATARRNSRCFLFSQETKNRKSSTGEKGGTNNISQSWSVTAAAHSTGSGDFKK